MPTPAIDKRVPGPMSLRERLEKQITSVDRDKHLDMGDGAMAASTATPKRDLAAKPAGKALDLG